MTDEACELASLYMRERELYRLVEKGEKLSDTGMHALRKYRKRIEQILGATLFYPEDKVEVKDGRALISEFTKLRNLPEFEEDKKKEEALFHLMKSVFYFHLAQSSISKYYYSKDWVK